MIFSRVTRRWARTSAINRCITFRRFDESAFMGKLAAYLLQDRGHAVEIAGDGQEAIYLTEQKNYDVILMDVQMPGMNGLEATAASGRRSSP